MASAPVPQTAPEPGPLAGVLVIDVTHALSGPHATMQLGDLGARVIKIEPPHGDESRGWGPPFAAKQVSTYFMAANRNKESVVLDLRTVEGLSAFEAMIAHADVLAENFRVGTLARLGLTQERLDTLNPRLIVLSISGFGPDGPESSRGGYDQIAQGEGGMMHLTGTKVGVPIADLVAGLNGAQGVLAALYQRERTGRGSVVHTSLLAGMVGTHAYQGTCWTVAGQAPSPSGTHHAAIAPYGDFTTATSKIQIACASESIWRSLCEVTGLDAGYPQWAANDLRVADRSALTAALEEALRPHSADHWLATLTAVGVPAGRVRDVPAVYEWEQTRSQGLIIDVTHHAYGTVSLPGPTLRTARHTHTAPPLLGEHTAAVLAEFGVEDYPSR